MERREACREAGIRKIKAEITERRVREGLSLKRGEKI